MDSFVSLGGFPVLYWLAALANASPDTATAIRSRSREEREVPDLHGACGFRDTHDDTMGTMKNRLRLATADPAAAGQQCWMKRAELRDLRGET